MSPNLYNDIAADEGKVVVVYLTSGDAGLPFKKQGNATPYPVVRELASIDALGWVADAGKAHVTAKQVNDVVAVHGHKVQRVRYANTVSYFLRLPDGNFFGNGFAQYGAQSLRKLKSGEIKSITPIDGQAAYVGWADFVTVLSDIFAQETAGETDVHVHVSEPDVQSNTNDHSDHTTGASAVLELLAQQAGEHPATHCYTVYKHIDYAIAEKPANLEGDGLQNKSGSFAVLTATQRHMLDFHNWDKAHLSYIARNYFTTETLPQACGATE